METFLNCCLTPNNKISGVCVIHPNVYICLFGWENAVCGRHIVKARVPKLEFPPPLYSLLQLSLLEYFPWYLQIAHGWVWLILIKFNLFWWSIWKRPKCCLPSVCELSDKDGCAVDHLSPSSRCSEGACVRCTLALLHSGPHTWLFTTLWLSAHPFLQTQVSQSALAIRV